MIKGVIFDLDGVLIFTDSLHYKAWKKMADEEGIPFDENDNLRLRGVSRMESLSIILEKASREYSEEEKQAQTAGAAFRIAADGASGREGDAGHESGRHDETIIKIH